MKVLITGATGFLGSHLVKSLLLDNHEIIILKRSFSDITLIKDVLFQIKAFNSSQRISPGPNQRFQRPE
jgi:CDP-paratose synthetase